MTSARLLLLASAFGLLPLASSAQQNSTFPTPPGSSTRSSPSPTTIDAPRDTTMPDGPLDAAMVHRREEARKLDRKKRMVDSANRLLALTEQLQADLKGREATPEDQKRLDEIARLARQVKDQMRN